MTQYIVFRHQDEVPSTGNLRAYYEASIVGYYIGERGKKQQSIQHVAVLLGVSAGHINLVPMVVNDSDIRSSIARIKGAIMHTKEQV